MSVYFNMEVAKSNGSNPPTPTTEWVTAKLFIINCHTEPPDTTISLRTGTEFWEDIKGYISDDYLIGCIAWGYTGEADLSSKYIWKIFDKLNRTNCPMLQELAPFNSDSNNGGWDYMLKIPAFNGIDIIFGNRGSSTGDDDTLVWLTAKGTRYSDYNSGRAVYGLSSQIAAEAGKRNVTPRGEFVKYSFLISNSDDFDENLKLWVCTVWVGENGEITMAYLSPVTQSTPSLVEILRDSKPDGYVGEPTNDPYNPGGESGTGGGTGDFSGTGDNIEIPSLPTLSAVDTGFITLFNPTIGQLYELANYMWSDLFDLEAWKKIFADPMDAILGMSIVPVNVPSGAVTPVTVGNISTGVSMTRAASQFVSVDCGTLNVKEFWGAYLDYDPYTKAEIYLPYIGTHALAVDDIMNKSVHVVYHVDILSGACCAYVKCGGSVLYTFVGQCSCSIPITGNDWTNVINGALSIATAIGSMVATGGASAPLAVASVASTAVNSMKPNVEKSGSLGGMGGMMGIQTPYLILTRPRQALPKYQNKYMGYPSFITSKLSELSGYTEIESIHLDSIPATEQELSEIETLLKGGVIL